MKFGLFFQLEFFKILSKSDSSLRCFIKVLTVVSRKKSLVFVNQNHACLAIKQGFFSTDAAFGTS